MAPPSITNKVMNVAVQNEHIELSLTKPSPLSCHYFKAHLFWTPSRNTRFPEAIIIDLKIPQTHARGPAPGIFVRLSRSFGTAASLDILRSLRTALGRPTYLGRPSIKIPGDNYTANADVRAEYSTASDSLSSHVVFFASYAFTSFSSIQTVLELAYPPKLIQNSTHIVIARSQISN